MTDSLCGKCFVAETRYGPMVHAQLRTEEENSGKLVAEVRQLAHSFAQERSLELTHVDGPAGIHDVGRAGRTTHLTIPALVCINKYDINTAKTREIAADIPASWGADKNVAIVCRDAFAMLVGQTTPLTPILFDCGIDAISGSKVVDEPQVLRYVSQRATFQQIRRHGVRFLTMTK